MILRKYCVTFSLACCVFLAAPTVHASDDTPVMLYVKCSSWAIPAAAAALEARKTHRSIAEVLKDAEPYYKKLASLAMTITTPETLRTANDLLRVGSFLAGYCYAEHSDGLSKK